MTKDELSEELFKLKKEFYSKQNQLKIKFCKTNNPYKVGDKFTDHIGTIVIEKIQYSLPSISSPCCVYFGVELNKDGIANKRNKKREAWQTNELKTT